ncbi:uncharacterized protein LOC130648141 [Hydractinia symbiolongicarpus]|uniref:uncharacterized protein LOC130648141 n=1 Tax=Hydractinia symbiolongicarpus TaxID=13093 RepID=UPI002549CB3D|nr:uncharacterized protein LOC130648141 [Hydractinia symbiolongicarpus]
MAALQCNLESNELLTTPLIDFGIYIQMPVYLVIVGNLKKNETFWEDELECSPYVLGIIKNGYRLPFKTKSSNFFAKNNASSLRHKNFIEDSIEDLLLQGCIEEDETMPYCCNPLTVAEGKNGYHHITIQEQDRTFLGFSWTYGNGLTKFYHFLVLPFGLASACYVFTKVLKPLIKKWRKSGIKITLYLDHGILCARSYSLTKFQVSLVQNDLHNSGFIVYLKKSHLEPAQIGTWLGFNIDTTIMEFSEPKQKIIKLLHLFYI